jgi:ABC-2 type transport system ATP-binding protein
MYMPKPVVIETQNLTKYYKKLCAVHNLSLQIEEGDRFGFLGPNGAGKTTTIKMLTGFLKPTSGSIRVMGIDMLGKTKEAKAAFGLVPDQYGFYDDLTAMDHLRYYAELYGVPKNEIKSRSEDILQMVTLTEKMHIRVKEFSHGMRQRLVIAQALINQPKVLFLDEPTTGLDPRGSYEVREIIKKLASEGMTLFISSHLLHEVQELCNKVAIIDRGILLRMDMIDKLADELTTKVGILVNLDMLEINDEIVEAIKKTKGYIAHEMAGNYLRVRVEGHEVTPEIPAAVIKAGGKFRSSFEIVPNLEQIFLELTKANQSSPPAKGGGMT